MLSWGLAFSAVPAGAQSAWKEEVTVTASTEPLSFDAQSRVVQVVTRYPSVPMPKRLLFWFVVGEDRVEIEEVTGEISFSVP